MPLFKRDKVDDDAIPAFWLWWASRRGAVEEAIATGTAASLVGEITARVKAIDDLAWELAPGRTSKHAFCLSSEGDITQRPTTERWLMAAPPADATWEYHAARQGGKLLVLVTGGRRLDQKEFRIGAEADTSRRRLDVALFHPGHAGMPKQACLQNAFLFLDHCLGEDDVERWIGKIDIAESEPTGSIGPDGLIAAVEALRTTTSDRTFAVLRGQDKRGNPVIVTVDLGLKRIDHLFHDRHGVVTFPLGSGWPPDSKILDAANAAEDDLLPKLDGSALYVGHVTQTGARILHFVAEVGSQAEQLTDAWLRANPSSRGSARWETDSKWAFRSELGG